MDSQVAPLSLSTIGIGIIGCGDIVRDGHLAGYQAAGFTIVGVYDPSPAATASVTESFRVGQIYDSVDELLSDDRIAVVDIATHPEIRAPIIHQAMAAGKHVLSQKPFALDYPTAVELVEAAADANVKIAVNQNGRFAPSWSATGRLIERGEVGDVFSVVHVLDQHFGFTDVRTHYSGLIMDYALHWIDVSGYWLRQKTIDVVRARTFRVPGQVAASLSDWGGGIEIDYTDGSSVCIRSVGGSVTSATSHPFWVHGSEGVIRGSILGNDSVELERDGVYSRFSLEGDWWSIGFRSTMAELLAAVAEDRDPSNSGRDNLRTVALSLAAALSASEDGRPVTLAEVVD